jgi:hypothetical protein
LLASTLAAYRNAHPKDLIHEHYLGVSADAANPHVLVRRLIDVIRRTTGARCRMIVTIRLECVCARKRVP